MAIYFCVKVMTSINRIYQFNTKYNRYDQNDERDWMSWKTSNEKVCVRVVGKETLPVFFLFFFCFFGFFSVCILFHGHSRFTGQQGKGEAICSTPLYHFHPFHRHLGISWVITAESSPLHIASNGTWPGNLCLPSASC